MTNAEQIAHTLIEDSQRAKKTVEAPYTKALKEALMAECDDFVVDGVIQFWGKEVSKWRVHLIPPKAS